MESPITDSVGQAEPKKTWTGAVVARLRPSGHHLSDEEIFDVINAVGDREVAADALAAKGITLPMYCLWKAKYRHLTLDEFRHARRQELLRARAKLGVLVAVVVLGGGGMVFGLARATQWNSGDTAEVQSPVTTVAPASASRPAPTPPVEPDRRFDPPLPTSVDPDSEPGYKIQVAAPTTVSEARLLVERLTEDGHSAYLFRTTVSNQEVFRVRVGPFDSLTTAEKTAIELRRAGYADAWITR
jgi:cell division septation protein DedD